MADFFKKMGSKFDALKKHKMNALANFNVPETPDEEFQAASKTFYELKDNVVTLVDSAEKFAKVMKDYTKALETITEGFGATMTAEGGGEGAGAPQCDAAAATQVVFDFSNRTQENCIAFFNGSVLDLLHAKREAIAVVERAIKERMKLKEEYDYYYEKVRKLREKQSKGDSAKTQEKVERNEPKLEEAKVELQKASAPLMALFAECQQLRPKIVAHEYEQFKKCQKVFFSTGVEKFDTLTDGDVEAVAMPTLQTDLDIALPAPASEGQGGGAAAAEPAPAAEPTDTADTEGAAGAAATDSDAQAAEASPAADAEATPTEAADGEAAPDGEGVRAVALFDFEPSDSDELKLVAGQELVVHVQNEGGWWEGEANGQIGLFPSSYVKLQK